MAAAAAAPAVSPTRRSNGTRRRGGHLREVRPQGGKMRKTMPRDKQLESMRLEYALCRVGSASHSFDPDDYTTYPAPGGGWCLEWACPVCGLEIVKEYDIDGFRVGRRNKYPKGYLMQEGGRLSADERAGLFMNVIVGRARR